MKAALVIFPGTNRDLDMHDAFVRAGARVDMVWHGDATLPACDLIVLPGGFSYGDYLRCGAMAAHSPVMKDVVKRAKARTPTFGVCNGFQTLIETGLLPGGLLKNASVSFVCRDVSLQIDQPAAPFTSGYDAGAVIRVPVAHGDGNYFADDDTLDRLEGEGRVAFRYVQGPDEAPERANPNGSLRDIAGITNEAGNVLGLMPHPEDATDARHKTQDGVNLFAGMVEALS